jgi:hypothetical protein
MAFCGRHSQLPAHLALPAAVPRGVVQPAESSNLGLPNFNIGNPLAGTISTTINPERQNQFALKLYF